LLEASQEQILIPGAGWRAFDCGARGDWFAAANAHSNAAYLFDRSLTRRVAETGYHPGADAVAVSPDGRWFATGSGTDRQVKVWEANSRREMLTMFVGPAPQVAFSADGQWLAASGSGFHLYATGSWQPAVPLPIPDGTVLGAGAFSADGRVLAVISDLYTVRLFDLRTWQPLGVLQPPGNKRMTGLAFSPDGTRLAAAGDNARLRVWDLHRIRQRLVEFDLDWDLPPLPPPKQSPENFRLVFAR
jgi:WD40 repeat protein